MKHVDHIAIDKIIIQIMFKILGIAKKNILAHVIVTL